MSIWRVGATAALACVMVAASATQSKFTLKVHTGRGQVGYDVNSTMIIGERDILLIDPQFSLSEAHKLAAEILESKKRLATIYSTHAHPDHLFGLAVLKQAFLDWLAEPPLGSRVLAFTSARGRDGGVGATYVLLRRSDR